MKAGKTRKMTETKDESGKRQKEMEKEAEEYREEECGSKRLQGEERLLLIDRAEVSGADARRRRGAKRPHKATCTSY